MVENSERPNKRLRRLSTDYDDSEGTDDWMPSKGKSKGRADAEYGKRESYTPTASSGRPARRSGGKTASSVTVARPPAADLEDPKRSIRLTVKVPASKLREATSGNLKDTSRDARNIFDTNEIVTGPRGTRAKRAIVEDSGSSDDDEDDDDEEEEEEVDEDDDEDEQDEDMDDDAEGDSDDLDAEGDIEMADSPPPPPIIKTTRAPPGSKPKVTVTPALEAKVKSVEAKELEDDDDDDDELSELGSDDDEEEEASAEGEEVEGDEGPEEEDEEDEEEVELSDDDATPASGSRASTPDLSKLTRRQRMRMDEITGGELLELPSESKAKKILSAEEHAMRRAEMARRRKNLSEKRNEEEKMDTINKLLKKQAPKQRRAPRGQDGLPAVAGDTTPNTQDAEIECPKSTMARWISNRHGSRVAVPEEWLGAPLGNVFGPGTGVVKMVEEVT